MESSARAAGRPDEVLRLVEAQSERVLETYRVDPGLIQEHANSERRITAGGYGDRQLFELVQNAADEIRLQPGGKIQVVLTEDYLYCANQGTPVTAEGAETILRMGVSRKRGGQIGRFGVGVKSVLSVSDAPQFFSTTGDFGFDREWSGELIRGIHGEAYETPVLRMARALNQTREREADQILDSLLSWATTVVRLPLLPGAAARLGLDIAGGKGSGALVNAGFPAQFQLFSNHVGTVLLEDRRTLPPVRREIEVEFSGAHHLIREARSGTKLNTIESRVFSVSHSPTPAARESAGELHDRGTIDISWAVPAYSVNADRLHTVPVGRGSFWSFFPTKYHMSLSGILNAAWKTNEDRQNLLDGSPLNQELLQVSARLVMDSLPELVPADDPAAYLALLPGRVTETLHWADELLTRQIYAASVVRPSLPDQNGVLRTPDELKVHPKDLTLDVLRLWAEYKGRPTGWVHHSVDANALRHGKVERILAAAKMKPETVRSWLEALVADGTAVASATAIRILSELINKKSPLCEEARTARIVLTEAHGLVAPVAGRVFKRSVEDGLADDLVYVDPSISDMASMFGHLERIGIRDADAQGRFRSVLDQGFANYNAESWGRFWELLRSAGGTDQVGEIHSRVTDPLATLQARTVAGSFRCLRDCLLPGPVVPATGRDEHIAVDVRFHSDDLGVLRELGLKDRPTNGHRPEGEAWFDDYHQALYDAYCRQLPASASRPAKSRVQLGGSPTAGPLRFLTALSPEGRAAFLTAMSDEGTVGEWTRQIGAQASTRSTVVSPLRWMLRRYGQVQTSQGLVPLREAVGGQLREYSEVLPVAEISVEKARKLRLPTTVDEVPSVRWTGLLEKVLTSKDDLFVGRAYALLLRVEYGFPEDVATRCRIGDEWGSRPDAEIAVAATRDEYDDLVRERIPALLVLNADSADSMIKNWGMLRHSDVISKELRKVEVGPPTLAVDEFPPLRQRLGAVVTGLMIQRCSELEHITRTPEGSKATPLSSARQDSTTLVLNPPRPLDALIAADREFGWGLGAAGCELIIAKHLEQQHDLRTRTRLNEIRDAESVIDKIALLIDAEPLRRGLPEGLLASEIAERGAQPDSRRLAEMAYNAHGEAILRVHTKDLVAAFPSNAPTSFTGSHQARQFVTSLGFPDSFAGAKVPSLEPRLEVEGPSEFPALHDYQERLAVNLFNLLERTVPQRAMLSLPTGAGKTRVTSEGVIRWIRSKGSLSGPILWIAQTEELCEQAVQSWSFVWSKVGADKSLVISRLWSSNEATPVDDRPHLVVATDAKLQICLGSPEYAWLRDPALVIVDEAHVAISARYTELLEQLGLTHSRTERHLVGLTATPFRNNADLTHRLVQRVGGTRLDHDVFDGNPIKELQELGVLARVRHRELAGATIQLTSDELTRSEQFQGLLPKAAEQRLADDHDRNQRIVQEIEGLPGDWPVLVFATSVAHAKFLAAKLGDRGIKAAAIDSATPIGERRQHIDAFRRGRIRVLTNYGVLTQGFDAPATRAVVVARPTYSPNIYQQMIGRGLRGPRNNGTPTCLILNVRDNITNYGEELAFDKFEYLWGADK